MAKALVILIAAAVVLGGSWWYISSKDVVAKNAQGETVQEEQQQTTPVQKQSPSASGGDDNLVEFGCAGGKSITGVFRPDSVALTLSDGRQMELRQEVSGSGIRYVGVDGAIEFRGEGDKGFLVEGGKTTFSDCVAK